MARLRTRSLLGITAVSLLAAFPAYSAETKPQVQQGLTIIDANKKKVGDLIGFTNSPEGSPSPTRVPVVALRIGEYSLMLGVRRVNFVHGPGGFSSAFFYTDTYCSSETLYIVNTGEDGQYGTPLTLYGLDDWVVYAQTGVPEIANIKSYRYTGDPTCFSDESVPPTLADAIPVRKLIDLSKHFTPPFSVK